jgi:dolichol-phosphate mannosyltransferase
MQSLPLELAIVVPTFNEKANIDELVNRLGRVLQGIEWEVVFVDDDSPDGTAEHIKQLSLAHPRVRCIHRIQRRGLSSACVEGMLSSSATYLAVMDADLQHPPSLIPEMINKWELIKV